MNFRDRGFSDCSDQYEEMIDAPKANGGSRADAQPIPSKSAPRLDVVCMADVRPKPIEWLWKFWIAIGKVSVLAGDGGKGKSTILCDLSARTSKGDLWPDGAQRSAPGGVLILAAE